MADQECPCSGEMECQRGDDSCLHRSEHDRLIVENETHSGNLPDVRDVINGEKGQAREGDNSDESETDHSCDSDCTHSCSSSTRGSPLPTKKFLDDKDFVIGSESHLANSVMALHLKMGYEDCDSCVTSTNVTPVPYRKFRPPESDAGTDLLPICRICQLPGDDDDDDVLFSPCRCSGSLRYVHYSCLLKWIDVCSRKTKKPPRCELCFFPYIRHKRFKFHHWRLPRVTPRDKCLHLAFFFNLVIMVGCAVATVLCFLSDKGQITNLPKNKVELTSEEVITLACGVFFFVSFFIAMTVEIKAKHTVYKLFIKFLTQNTEWQIEPYDRSKDPMYNMLPSHVV